MAGIAATRQQTMAPLKDCGFKFRRVSRVSVKKVVEIDVPVQTEDASSTASTTTKVEKERRRRRSSFAAIASRAPPRPSSISVSLSQKMLPASVAPCDYHKHLMPDLPGPIKMRQLLLWAVQRAGARQKNPKVQGMVEETVQALFNNKINTSWYQRPASAGTKSGPKNQELADCIQLYQRYSERYSRPSCTIHANRLKQELNEWNQLQQQVTEIPKTDLEFTSEYPLTNRPIRDNLKSLGQWFDTLSSAVSFSICLIF
ncbi:hypothetical protein PSACC_00641 [Paramicrosporidium saccamoebae]|uniref:Uncharacterized protein n=1 Tax=Paramicrosporidium saccamoebae TaxID=1246581 RepID=A0A2H9TPG1_9FUNG|nr:hypothetical protein PSACC_00641 [Paramicrosporidium saccamoebae]